jgi:hypothetical protein
MAVSLINALLCIFFEVFMAFFYGEEKKGSYLPEQPYEVNIKK